MTLTLDEVRKTKFHMARRNGYEVSEVDQFVDRVEVSFAQLSEENRMLKEQVDSLKQGAQGQNRRGSGSDDSASHTDNSRTDKKAANATAAVTKGEEKLVVTTSAEASPAVVRLVQMATEQSEQLVAEAEAEAKRKVEAADQRANQITGDAKAQADKLASDSKERADKLAAESKANADKLTADSKARAEDLDRQTTARRAELFSSLESERDQLRSAIRELRGFEAAYRKNLASHLREQITSIERGVFEPEQKPGLLGENAESGKNSAAPAATEKEKSGVGAVGPTNADGSRTQEHSSNTPRLDALMGEKKS